MTQDNRLDKIEKSLTPKQAVVFWLHEIQDYRNPREYVLYLKGLPESEAPITKLTEQITIALRKEMRGSSKDFVDKTVRRAVKDVVFLVKLHLAVNFELMRKMREWRLSQIALAECLDKIHVEMMLRNFIVDIADRVNFQTPYPLDSETAAAVDSAIRHHVYAFDAFEEEGIICDWLWDYLIDRGGKTLPVNSYEFPDGQYHPAVNQSNEKEVRDCFQDEAQFELFRSGQDYTCGLANVSNAEYYRYYDTIVSNLQEMAKSGQVQTGRIVRLETIPIPFLRDVPLVEGEWLDRRLVELAEFGALLKAQGFEAQEDENANLLAAVRFTGNVDQMVTPEALRTSRQKAKLFLKKYSGRTREIDGQPFIHFEDYCRSRTRKVKGNLQQQVKEGLITSSWNCWVKEHSGEKAAMVADVAVGELHCYINRSSYYSCQGEVEEQLHQREELLDNMRCWSFKPERKENLVNEWKESVVYYLVELYAFRQAVASIQKSYFDGQAVVFLDTLQELTAIITQAETTVNNFNASFADDVALYKPIDLGALHINADQEVNRVITYFVDTAKVEALDCLGDTETARELAEKYL